MFMDCCQIWAEWHDFCETWWCCSITETWLVGAAHNEMSFLCVVALLLNGLSMSHCMCCSDAQNARWLVSHNKAPLYGRCTALRSKTWHKQCCTPAHRALVCMHQHLSRALYRANTKRLQGHTPRLEQSTEPWTCSVICASLLRLKPGVKNGSARRHPDQPTQVSHSLRVQVFDIEPSHMDGSRKSPSFTKLRSCWNYC